MGLRVGIFTPRDVDDSRRAIKALQYDAESRKWTRRWMPFPGIIYDRCRYHGTATYQMLRAFRNKHKRFRYLAKPLANKWTLHGVLAEHERIAGHLPDTQQYSGFPALNKLLQKHATVYLKPKNGTGGRGIVRVDRLSGGEFILRGRSASRTILPKRKASAESLAPTLRSFGVSERYIMQQGIPSLLTGDRVCDFRLLIQKNGSGAWEVTGCAGRIGPSRSITSNLHGGGNAIAMHALLRKRFDNRTASGIKQTMYSLSETVAAHLETHFGQLCELGIDLAVAPDGQVWLLEVNPKPSREVFRRIGETGTYRTAIQRPLEYANWLLERSPAAETEGEPQE